MPICPLIVINFLFKYYFWQSLSILPFFISIFALSSLGSSYAIHNKKAFFAVHKVKSSKLSGWICEQSFLVQCSIILSFCMALYSFTTCAWSTVSFLFRRAIPDTHFKKREARFHVLFVL